MADNFDLEGLEQLLYSMDNVTEEVRKAMWSHIKASAQRVRDEARRLAPEQPHGGRLKRSIQVAYDEDALEAVVYSKLFYSYYVELGTVQAPAQPFLHPAVEKERNPFLSGLLDVIK